MRRRMSERGRGASRVITAIAVVAAVMFFCSDFRPTPPNLMARSTRVTDLDPRLGQRCFWLSNTQALLVGTTSERCALTPMLLDVRTGARRVLQPFASRFGAMRYFGAALSPDRKWLAWDAYDGDKTTVMTATLDASQVREWTERRRPDNGMVPPLVWFPDSRRLVEVRGTYLAGPGLSPTPEYAVIHSLDTNVRALSVPLPTVVSSIPVGVTREGRLLLRCDPGLGMGMLPDVGDIMTPAGSLSECTLNPRRPLTGQLAVLPPGVVFGSSVAVSPGGDRIAWVLAVTDSPRGSAVAPPFMATSGGRSKPVVGIWVTGLSGGTFTRLGTVPSDPGANPRRIDDRGHSSWPSSLQWLPDGKHLSFLYHDAIYTVPDPAVPDD